jgi:uncharacterized membrane protein
MIFQIYFTLVLLAFATRLMADTNTDHDILNHIERHPKWKMVSNIAGWTLFALAVIAFLYFIWCFPKPSYIL